MSNFDTFVERKLRPITLSEPANSFERGILDAYNKCRAEALHKYFPMLNGKNIEQLLKDNYLQKNDLVDLLQN